ncbi:MAG: NYN domain-containing protein [Patescibacteria group bacterium]
MPYGDRPVKIAVFIDNDNIEINMKSEPLEKLSMDIGWERFKIWLSSYGDIAFIFVFAPEDKIRTDGKYFYKQGFIPVSCPIIINEEERRKRDSEDMELLLKEGKDREFDPLQLVPTINTTDEIMIKTAQELIPIISRITHVCIASGDEDFLPIAKMAKKNGKKIMIMISDYKSPSKELLLQASIGPNGKKMIHLFDPIKE